jgi:hypothetical protein
LANFLLSTSYWNDFGDHEAALRSAYAQLPGDVVFDQPQLEAIIGRGYLLRGTRCLLWGRNELGAECFQRAYEMEVSVDDAYVAGVTHQLLNCELELGPETAQKALDRLAPHIDRLSGRRTSRLIRARLASNRAFRRYYLQDYGSVPADCVSAIVNDVRNITNRGVLSVFVRSLAHSAMRNTPAT